MSDPGHAIMESPQTPERQGRASKTFWIVLGAVLGVALLWCAGIPLANVLIALGAGWIMYLVRVVPQVQISWPGMLGGACCLAGVIVLGHGISAWLWRETAATAGESRPRRWRGGWTLAAVGIVVLMFVAGIAAVGATHQSAWLIRSDAPIFEFRSIERSNRVKCGSNMKSFAQAIVLYANEHNGQLPDTLEQLLLSQDVSAETYVCPSSDADSAPGQTREEQARQMTDEHNSYVYHGRGHQLGLLPPDFPLLCEPLRNHDADGMNILFGNMQTQWMSPAEADRVLRGHGKSRQHGLVVPNPPS
jgi:hypothetical protein